jgi:hypothetical protein
MKLQNNPQNNNSSIFEQIAQFSKQIEQTGKTPETILKELINSGRISNTDFERAKRMAESFLANKK